MKFLEFTFQSFWHWLGVVILVAAILPWGRFSIISVNRKEDN